MNGEEKILAMLEQLQQGQARLEQGYAKLEQGQAKLEQGQSKLERELTSLKDTVQTVKNSQLKVELEQFPKIAAAIDGAVGGTEKNKEQDSRISILESKSENQGNRILDLEYAFKTK